MHMVIRKFRDMQNVAEAARRAETGLAPILKRQPGFKGYYIVAFADGGGGSVSLFDSADAARAAHEQAMTWIRENLADLSGGAAPEVTMGEVLASVVA
jgi:hypothetical protein